MSVLTTSDIFCSYALGSTPEKREKLLANAKRFDFMGLDNAPGLHDTVIAPKATLAYQFKEDVALEKRKLQAMKAAALDEKSLSLDHGVQR